MTLAPKGDDDTSHVMLESKQQTPASDLKESLDLIQAKGAQ